MAHKTLSRVAYLQGVDGVQACKGLGVNPLQVFVAAEISGWVWGVNWIRGYYP